MNDFLTPEWLIECDRNSQEEIAVLNSWNGRITQSLTPLSHNEAALSWNFDPLHKNNQEIIIRLTDDEANRIFHSDIPAGMIEDVRHEMTYPEAVLRIKDAKTSQIVAQKNHVIDRTLTEEEFSRKLDEEIEKMY